MGDIQKDVHFDEVLTGRAFDRNKPLKTLVYLFKDSIGKIALSLVFFVIKHTPVWVMPIVIGNVIDIATNPNSRSLNEMWINLIIAAILVVQNLPSAMFYTKYLSKGLRAVETDLRSKLVRKLQILSISYHKQMKAGRIQSKILRDVEAITVLARQVFNGVIPMVVNMVVALSITLYKSYTVAAFFVLAIPISALIIRFFRKNIRTTNTNFRKEIEEMSAKVAEMVEMVPITKAHGLENVEIERIDKQLLKVKNRGYSLDMLTAFFGASSWISFQVFQVGCLAFTGYLAYNGKISVGDVVLYQTYFTTILNQVSSLINIYPEIVKGFESINSVGEIFQSEDIEDNKGKKRLKDISGEYSFENVEFKYINSEKPIIKNFSLDIKKGECIAFVGESGAGKTTLLNLIIGFYKATKGRVLIDGTDLSEVNMNSYRKHIAVVPQSTILFSGTIRDNITYGLSSVTEERIKEVVEAVNLTEVIKKLPKGLDTHIGEHGDMLSGGQKQRISIARALMREPKVIIFDEPTSALDSVSERHVQQAMGNLTKGRTTFIVAHRLSTIRDADRIVVVRDGNIVECGNYKELMNIKGEFYQMQRLQA